ncbi:MAG TPA: hypothetical protein DCW68_04255 [Rhodospirillaceae bacterium]|nr:MAG: hypothetical protein A2018_07440 [Alphaproteobacteria bacterium GWF2_58_20]HAU29308.1 hypothetical protein [Rhodospirillaceae bacterium]
MIKTRSLAMLASLFLMMTGTASAAKLSDGSEGPFFIRKPLCMLDGACVANRSPTTPEDPDDPGDTDPPEEGDTAAPLLSSTTPPNDAADVWTTASPLMVFNEAVQKGTGNIVIQDITNGVVFETIDASGPQVSISENQVSLLLSSDFSNNRSYAITADAGSIKDLAGNPFVGISETETWNFTTQSTATAEVFASFPTSSARDTEAFTTDGKTYIAATNHYNGSTFNLNSKIYRFEPGNATPTTRVIEVASVATNGVLDWESFEVSGQTYLAFANFYNNTTYNLQSKVYRFTPGDATPLVEIASVATQGAAAWEAFTIDGQTYLAVANYLAHTGTYNQTSRIYRFTPGDATPFVEVASVATNGANDWEAIEINGRTYLALATLYSSSRVFSFTPGDTTPLIEVATVATNTAFKWTGFTKDNVTYLAVANMATGASSRIYRFDPDDATPMLEVASVASSGLNWDVFTMGGNTYLTLATNATSTSKVYIFDPTNTDPALRLVENASFPTMTAMSADIFTHDGQTYVSFANYTSANSWVYRFYP